MIKEIYKRLILPLYLPILMLVPYLLILSSKEKLNYKKLKFITFLIGFLIIIISEGIVRFLDQELKENFFLFIAPLIILVCLYFALIYKLNFKK